MADNKEALPVLGWLIQYGLEGYVRHTVSGHNSVADYRVFDPDATSTELTSLPAATAALSELRAEVERKGKQIETLLRWINEARQLVDPIWRERMGAESVREYVQRSHRCLNSAVTDCRFFDTARSAASGESAEGGV